MTCPTHDGKFCETPIGVLVHHCNKLVQGVGGEVVVGVYKKPIFTLCQLHPTVACSPQARIGLMHNLYARVLACQRIAHLRSVVVATIVDEQHLPISKRLLGDAVDAAQQGGFGAKYGDDDGESHVEFT